MKNLLANTKENAKTVGGNFLELHAEVYWQMMQVKRELLGIEWDDMSTAEHNIWNILFDNEIHPTKKAL